MALETKFICQTYRKNKRGQLEMVDARECASALAAKERAQKLWDSGAYAGVDAFELTADAEEGEYGEPTFLARHKQVPDVD